MLKNSMNKLWILSATAVMGVWVAACADTSAYSRSDTTYAPGAVPAASAPKASYDGRIYDPKWGLRRP